MWFLSIIPFYYTQKYRYYQGKKIFSFFFGELLLSLTFLFQSNIDVNLTSFLLIQLIFWGVYECGYLDNDCVATKCEESPTVRAPQSVTNHFETLIIFKLLLAVILIIYVVVSGRFSFFNVVPNILLICLVFFAHNRLVVIKYRFITLGLLAYLRQIYVIDAFDGDVFIYSFILLPFFIVKFLSYMWSKKYVIEDLREDIKFKFNFYLGWALLIVFFVSWNYWPVYALLFLNQNKRYLIREIRNLKINCG